MLLDECRSSGGAEPAGPERRGHAPRSLSLPAARAQRGVARAATPVARRRGRSHRKAQVVQGRRPVNTYIVPHGVRCRASIVALTNPVSRSMASRRRSIAGGATVRPRTSLLAMTSAPATQPCGRPQSMRWSVPPGLSSRYAAPMARTFSRMVKRCSSSAETT